MMSAALDALAPLGVRHIEMPLTPETRVARDPQHEAKLEWSN